MYRVGSLHNSKAVHYKQKQLLWEDEKINVLGVFVTNDTRKLLQLNYSDLIYQKVPSILALWARRNLSLFGKVLIVNTLVASLFVYEMTVLLLMPKEYITKLNQCFTNFLWNDRKLKIKIIELDSMIKKCAMSFFGEIKMNIWKCNLKPADAQKCFKEGFWRDVLFAWVHYNYAKPEAKEEFQMQWLWYNSHIQIGKKPTFLQKAYSAGLETVEQLFNL